MTQKILITASEKNSDVNQTAVNTVYAVNCAVVILKCKCGHSDLIYWCSGYSCVLCSWLWMHPVCVLSVSEAVQQASGPLLVEIVKGPAASLGISLTTTIYRGKQVIIIDKIKAASVVERWFYPLIFNCPIESFLTDLFWHLSLAHTGAGCCT